MKTQNHYIKHREAVLYQGDCKSLLEEIPRTSIDLTVSSPPYCMGKEYETCTDVSSFRENHEWILPRIVELTKPGGSICWQVGYHVRNNALTPLDFIVHEIMSKIPGVILRNRIIWTFGHGAHLNKRFSGRHEVILWYTNGESHYFDLDAVRVPQKYPGKRHYKGPNRGEFSGNPLGKNPSDVWEIPHVKSAHVEKTEHPCQFPIALAQRLIKALCPTKGTVFDPYAGVGSTGVAALLEDRCFIGSEINKKYCEIAKTRFKAVCSGKLPYRPIDKAIYKPEKSATVARKPSHFIWMDEA